MTDHDWMETGSLVRLSDGWFFDTDLQVRFRLDENGVPVGEDGKPLAEQHPRG
jgi:hypothetical protein